MLVIFAKNAILLIKIKVWLKNARIGARSIKVAM